MRPSAADLYCGLGGWTEGFLSAGYRVVGFDNHRHEYALSELTLGSPNGIARTVIARYPAQLILQDALTIHGSQLKDAAVIVCSPPCQKYSYLAMPWSKSKCPLCKGKKVYFEWQLITGVAPGHMTEWGRPIPCDCKENSRKAKELRADWEKNGPDNRLFDACFRIQREAIEATREPCYTCGATGRCTGGEYPFGRCTECRGEGYGPARYIPLIVENVRGAVPWVGKRDMPLEEWNRLTQAEKIERGRPQAVFGSFYLWGDVAQIGNRVIAGRDLADIRAGRGRFGMGVAPEKASAQKVPGFWFDGSGRSFQTASVEAHGVKVPGQIHGKEYAMCRTGAHGQTTLATRDNFGWSKETPLCGTSSHSNARKAASALIAKIPAALSFYIAEVHKPSTATEAVA